MFHVWYQCINVIIDIFILIAHDLHYNLELTGICLDMITVLYIYIQYQVTYAMCEVNL